MGKGKKRSKKKAKPGKTGSDGGAAAFPTPAPPPSSGGAAAATEAADAPVANRECINCDNCGKANPQKRCSQCLCYYYCSKECQLKDWKEHKGSCASLKTKRDHYDAGRDRKNLPGGTPAVIDGPCAICLEEEVKHPVTFECGHTFCFKCVFMYQCKMKQPTCPYCRGEIPNVEERAFDRLILYTKRAEAAHEDSEERKNYCDLSMAEFDTLSQIYKDQKGFLYCKVRIISLSKDPQELLNTTEKILSGVQSRGVQLGYDDVVETKLRHAQACSKMGKWISASEIYAELRKKIQLSSAWHEFLLEMGYCRCLFELGDYDKAVECGNRAVSIGRAHAGAHEYLALAQKAAGNIDAAKKTMLKAILYEEQWNVENKEKNKQILRNL